MTNFKGSIFTVRETHGRAIRTGNRLIAHSPDAGWRSLYAAVFEEGPLNTSEPPMEHPSLIYHIARPTQVKRKIEGAPAEKSFIGPRRFTITPGETATEWQHGGGPEILQVYIRQGIFERAVGEMYGTDGSLAEIVPRLGVLDPLLEQLAIAILTALRTGESTDTNGLHEDGLYIDTLAEMIAVHLARTHSTRSRPVRESAIETISGRRIRRLIEFIEEHLDGDLSIEALATHAEISPLYLARAFKMAVGQSPHQYVLERRVERAKALLRSTDAPVVDVALSAGFSSQSHLSNRFQKFVGVSPAAYRRQGAK